MTAYEMRILLLVLKHSGFYDSLNKVTQQFTPLMNKSNESEFTHFTLADLVGDGVEIFDSLRNAVCDPVFLQYADFRKSAPSDDLVVSMLGDPPFE